MRVEQCRLISNDVSVNRHINFQSVLFFSFIFLCFVVGFRVDFSFFSVQEGKNKRRKEKVELGKSWKSIWKNDKEKEKKALGVCVC